MSTLAKQSFTPDEYLELAYELKLRDVYENVAEETAGESPAR
jgi:hypothetical protein